MELASRFSLSQPTVDAAIPSGVGRAAAACLLIGAAAIAAYALLAPSLTADLLFVAVGATVAATVVAGVRRGRAIVPRAWLAVALAMGMLASANLLSAIGRSDPATGLRPVADVLYLGAYIPLFSAAFRFGRGARRSDRTALFDTGIVGVAAIPLVWELIVEPHVPLAGASVDITMALAMPVVVIVLVSLAAPLLYLRQSRSPSAFLFVGGLAFMGVGDSLFGLATIDGASADSTLINVCWLASYVLVGAASLVPSSRVLGAAHDPSPGSRDLGRLAVLAGALLSMPLVVLHETIGSDNPELQAFAGLSLAVAGLLILRLHRTIAQLGAADLRFRRFMSQEGFMASIKDPAGRYIYMNATAEAVPRLVEGEWYGHTDLDLYPPEIASRRVEADARVRRTGEMSDSTAEVDGVVWYTERFAMPGTGGGIGVLCVDITDRVQAEEQVRFQARLLASVQDAVIVVDTLGRVQHWNQGATEMLGYTADEMVGQEMGRFVAPGTEAQVKAMWAAAAHGNADLDDWRALRRDGTEIWLSVRVSIVTNADGEQAGFLGVAKDVTARKRAELEMARLGAAIDNARDAVIVTDGEDRVVYVNPAFERMTGFTAAEVLGERPVDSPGRRSFARALEQAKAAATGWRGDIVDRRKDGSDLICETSISPIAAERATAPGYVTVKRDVTRERAAERAAERRVRERALVAETLAALRADLAPEETATAVCRQLIKLPEVAIASVLTLGLGGAASVIGQAVRGGEAVTQVLLSSERSAYLRARAGAGPWVERWIGDPDHPYAAMLSDLGIIAHAYAPILVDGVPIGILVVGSDTIDAVDRMTERLPALVEFAAITSTLLASAVADRMTAAKHEAEVLAVIHRAAFRPVFQPIVDLASGEIRGYEALTRFADGTPADVRFEQARRLGLALELEAACLRAAFSAADGLPVGAWLNVNVSPEAVLAGLIESLLPAGPREVILEVTEHEAITDYATFRAAVEPIRDRVRIAVDDAGAGFASLRHIVELAPSMVKLDRSLIEGIGDDSARQAVVAGMVRFAQAASLTLLAEGIETADELDELRSLGVQLGQGFFLGMPEEIGPAGAEAGAEVRTKAAAPVSRPIASSHRRRRTQGAPVDSSARRSGS